MYSLVLATMLTTGAATPDFGRGCHGCCGGCYGCCGGCWGGCYGCCGGCWGGCYGCCGGCWGCYGCCGGCYGYGVSVAPVGGYWGMGFYGSCYGCWGTCYGCHGCYGCYGCYGTCYGGVVTPVAAAPVAPVAPATPTLPATPKKVEPKSTSLGNAAAVVLKAPTDVELSVEGQLIPRTAAVEVFRTPELDPAFSYTYTFKAKVVRNGKAVAFTKQVPVRAGQSSEADFTKLATEGKDVAKVTVKLPADARLYVDDVLCPLTSETRTFDTPALEPGRSYFYTLKAEFIRDGDTRTATKRVTVEAGKQVTVEFQDRPVQAVSR